MRHVWTQTQISVMDYNSFHAPHSLHPKGLYSATLAMRHLGAWSSWATVTCIAGPSDAYSEDEDGEVTAQAGRWEDVLSVSFPFFGFAIFDF